MAEKPGWEIDVKSCSHEQLAALLKLLAGGEHKDVQRQIRRELVDRARERGLTDQQVINRLVLGVPRGARRNEIAEDWADGFGISVKEFKRIASGK
jgi:hypothetical protein